MLITLGWVTIVSHFGALEIEKKHSKAVYIISFILEIAVLVAYKYTTFLRK